MRNNRCFARRNFLAADEYAQHHGADRADTCHKLSVSMKNMRSRLISESYFSAMIVSSKTIKSVPSPVYRTYASAAPTYFKAKHKYKKAHNYAGGGQ